MSVPHLLRSLCAEPLALERRTLDAFLSVLRRHGEGASFTGMEIHAETQVAAPRAGRQVSGDRTVEVIPIVGAIANRTHSMGAGADKIGAMIDAAAANPRVDAIVLDVDSPGGTVTGVPELAAKVFQARQAKPVVAVANGLMASAGYWISAAAGEVVVTPSGEVGSIGVIALHQDVTEALADAGIKVTEFSAGKYKTEGAPWKPLDEEARSYFEGRVADAYDWFVRDVAAFRGDSQAAVRAGYGEGRVLGAKEAVAAKLADRIGTLDETIARMASGGTPRRGARAEAFNAVERQARERERGR